MDVTKEICNFERKLLVIYERFLSIDIEHKHNLTFERLHRIWFVICFVTQTKLIFPVTDVTTDISILII